MFFASDGRNQVFDISSNFWATTSTLLVDTAITDWNDDFNLGRYNYLPMLTNAPVECYPFVVSVALSSASGTNVTVVGGQRVTFTVIFNRDMSTNVKPQISFGPTDPFTDYAVQGGWQDPRTWVGTFNVNPITGDGYQLIRVAGAVAADDPWLVTGDDSGRFRFEIITSGTESMNLQATGGEGKVDLSWMQDDFELLAGYNLYRSANSTNGFARINTSIVPAQQKAYRDTQVQPGQPYFYKFTVVKTDMGESDFSNVAQGTPLDTIPPVITHTPLTSGSPGLPLTLFADVTDNVGVQSVTLYFRPIGSSAYTTRAMTKTTGSRYAATIEGSRLVSPGVEYYIVATDDVTPKTSGRPELPNQILVVDKPVVTVISPVRGPASGGTTVTIAGANFKTGATVTIGGLSATAVAILSGNQIQCVSPAHFPATTDVAVNNPDGQSGILLRGFVFESDTVSLGLPNTGGGRQMVVQVPVNAANIQGLAAVDLTVTFNTAVLKARTARTGNLTPGWTVVANTNTAGQIRVSMASAGGTVTGSGVLVNLEFEVIGSPGANSVLHWASVSLNDHAIPASTADGSFAVNLVYDLSGTVRFWNGSAGVLEVALALAGDRVYSGNSASNGTYTVSGAEAGNYLLTPVKSDGVNGITAFDAALVLQHAAGLTNLAGNAARAADVDRSGTITSMDAFYILQQAVGLISLPFPGTGVVWDFSPTNRVFNNLSANQSGQDFTAILIGDVSGNWTASGGGAQGLGMMKADGSADAFIREFTFSQSVRADDGIRAPSSSPSAIVALDSTSLIAKQQNVRRVLLKTTAPVYSVDLDLVYDGAPGTVTRVQTGGLTATFAAAHNFAKTGAVRSAQAGALPISGDGVVLQLDVQVGSSGNFQIIGVTLNEGQVPVLVATDLTAFDNDSDGLLNVDEREVYRTNPDLSDTDGDGLKDGAEVQAGTSPIDRSSVLAMTSVVKNLDGSAMVSWSSVPGRTYQLVCKDRLAEADWKPLGPGVLAVGATASATDATAGSSGSRVYRTWLVE
jgi:hypothetical protein